MKWAEVWDKTKSAAKVATEKTIYVGKTVCNNIDDFEYRHFGDIDEKIDHLINKVKVVPNENSNVLHHDVSDRVSVRYVRDQE